jgi:8-oxo-dGTP pyrophosphatase MutT (NUDIX family)
VLLVHRTSDSVGTWALPGGTPHESESMAACARREVLEETGVSASPSISSMSWNSGLRSRGTFAACSFSAAADTPLTWATCGGRRGSSRPVPARRARLCVRHLLHLRALDPRAGQVAARDAVATADVLIAELQEAFRKGTWAYRHETRGKEMTAWRRAPAFLDGRVLYGCS